MWQRESVIMADTGTTEPMCTSKHSTQSVHAHHCPCLTLSPLRQAQAPEENQALGIHCHRASTCAAISARVCLMTAIRSERAYHIVKPDGEANSAALPTQSPVHVMRGAHSIHCSKLASAGARKRWLTKPACDWECV